MKVNGVTSGSVLVQEAEVRYGGGGSSFPDEAAALLSEVVAHPDPWIDQAMVSQAPELDRGLLFGQPPVVVASCGEVILQLLWWWDADTSVHDHGFEGAFLVLDGRSVHWTRPHGGEGPSPGSVEVLTPGAVRAIREGPSSTHVVVHVARPTLTLVLRTRGISGLQRRYGRAHSASPDSTPELRRRLLLLDALAHAQRLSVDRVRAWVREASAEEQIYAALTLAVVEPEALAAVGWSTSLVAELEATRHDQRLTWLLKRLPEPEREQLALCWALSRGAQPTSPTRAQLIELLAREDQLRAAVLRHLPALEGPLADLLAPCVPGLREILFGLRAARQHLPEEVDREDPA